MNRTNLIDEVAQDARLLQSESEAVIEAILDGIVGGLRRGEKIEVRGFGSFKTRLRRARVGRNPKTGVRVDVPPRRVPYFKASKELKGLINEKLETLDHASANSGV